ncbi:MAG: V-type ATPase subunit [Candidatus Omnitrophota bacterium]
MKNRYDYAYADGRVQALEKKLIPQGIFRDAIEADSIAEALSILSEFTHQESIKRIRNSADIESFLKGQKTNLNLEVTQLLDDPELANALFRLEEDKEASGIKAVGVKCELLGRLFNNLTNLESLTNCLRLNLTDKINEFYRGDYGSIARQALDAQQEENSYLVLERLKANYILNSLLCARYITFGPEPVIRYYFSSLNQIKLLRWVMLGKINQLPKDILLALI